jgi:hypothetical protein
MRESGPAGAKVGGGLAGTAVPAVVAGMLLIGCPGGKHEAKAPKANQGTEGTGNSQATPETGEEPERPEPTDEGPKPARTVVVSGQRWDSSAHLSPAAVAVLTSAFDGTPRAGEANAYDFKAGGGHRGMDWWNFPWDLRSTRPQYTLTYADMKTMLEAVRVQPTPTAANRIRYGQMLANMVEQLDPGIMNAHGGILRIVKIIYCVRNFLAVAIANNLAEDIPPLNEAARKILALNATGLLLDDPSPYLRGSRTAPKDPDGHPEDRTRALGIQAIETLRRNANLP